MEGTAKGYRAHQRLMPGQEGDNVQLCSVKSPPGKRFNSSA